ncbi:zinc finger, CCHC-type containing protein [Tanacetum coccineum]
MEAKVLEVVLRDLCALLTFFHISNCTVENQVKFATCTLLGVALTWWNSQELVLMCGRMFLEESDEVEKHVGGLPDMIQGSVMASKPKTMQEAIKIANDLMNQKEGVCWNSSIVQQVQVSPQWPMHCKKVGHLTRDCWNPTATSNQRTITCYECGNQGHYKSDCPKLKNQNHGNQAQGTEAREMLYALGGG